MKTKIRRYSELILLPTFEERFEYAKLSGQVGEIVFGGDRYLNQVLYRSQKWRQFRNRIILRDEACDLGSADYPIRKNVIVHHLNPLTIEDVENEHGCVFDPENVICVSHYTHEAIHYGDSSLLPLTPKERQPGDTKLW